MQKGDDDDDEPLSNSYAIVEIKDLEKSTVQSGKVSCEHNYNKGLT